MVEVECPSCDETVDLGSPNSGTYECPYCDEEFEWEEEDDSWELEPFDREYFHQRKVLAGKMALDRKTKNFLKKKGTKKDYEYPLKVGNLKARWNFPGFDHMIAIMITILLFAPFVVCFWVIGKVVIDFPKLLRHKREFAKNILDPEYLRGTGLVILPDYSAKLIAKSRTPAYEFEEHDITKIVLHETAWSRGRSDYDLHVYLHGFHALTLYGFNHEDSEDIVMKLISVYDIELENTYRFIKVDSGGGGSGGG
jgi:endogenous inhibitor of DNA gyrase (YacG/DUF329 family)